MTKEIVPTTEEHIVELSKTIREADRKEIWAAAHKEPYEAIKLGVSLSPESFTGLMDGKVVCIFGVSATTVLSDEGIPWMLASDLLDKTAYTFLRVNRVYIKEIRKKYTLLENYVDCRNRKALSWLKWLGFKLDKPRPYGSENLLFCRFEYRRV